MAYRNSICPRKLLSISDRRHYTLHLEIATAFPAGRHRRYVLNCALREIYHQCFSFHFRSTVGSLARFDRI